MKAERVDFRITPELKHLISQAARLKNLSLSAFFIEAATSRARELMATEEVLMLSAAERERFLDLLENPPEPPEALRKAMQRHQEMDL